MKRLVDIALRYRVLVLLGFVFVAAIGFVSLRNLPIDAQPDVTPNQVLVLTRAPSLSPLEVEQLLSFPVENAMRGLPGIQNIQSTSKYGLSYVAIYFKDGLDPFFCRALVNERLPQAKEAIPPDVGVPEMGPITTGLGEIYQFKVVGDGHSPMELRTILDWDVAPKLRGVPGVVEVNTDPMAIDQSDVYVMLKPVNQWPRKRTKADLIAAMQKRLEGEAPGALYSFSQPIQMRVQELMEGGAQSDVAIKLFGDDLDTLKQKADQIAAIISKVPGAQDVRAERVSGLPYLRIHLRREALARHNLDESDVLDTIEAIGGRPVGEIVEGNRRFTLQARFPQDERATADEISNLRVGDSEGHFIPLAQIADIEDEEGPAQISRENGQRRISVEANVRGRDIASFVAEAQKTVAAKVVIPSEYQLTWAGQFEQLQSASQRLMIVVPAALTLIFVLLYFNFQDFMPALLIFLNIPLAASGGIVALLLRGMPFSISAGVGFIALFGIAVLNGIVLLTHIRELQHSGTPIEEAVEQGARTRLRPVLMTALVASLGFVPMALSHGDGAEVQRPLATVVIGGLITSTLLTLLVLPSLYRWLVRRREGSMPS
jgi:cobalt-zinc-cadmium resistance protein CzcA